MDELNEAIERCTEQGGTHFSFSGDLREFPTEIFQFAPTLEELDLSGNQFRSLPDRFSDFKQLRTLFLSGNPLGQVPEVLSVLPELYMVGMRECSLEWIPENSLPPSIGWLILPGNRLTRLPASMGNLKKLRKFGVSGNQLSSLPDEMESCENLELFRGACNQFTEVPAVLFKIQRLAWIGFSGNPCTRYRGASSNIPHVPWPSLECIGELGRGASGTTIGVRLGTEALAAKVFKNSLTSDGSPQDEALAARLLAHHANTVHVRGECIDHPEGKLVLLFDRLGTEFRPLGLPPSFATCTRDRFQLGRELSQSAATSIVYGALAALQHIFDHGFIHGDLYAHNILASNDGEVRVSDFGAATYVGNLPEDQRTRLQQIEMRAVGCLIEEVLEICRWDGVIEMRLSSLAQRCLATSPGERPLPRVLMQELMGVRSVRDSVGF